MDQEEKKLSLGMEAAMLFGPDKIVFTASETARILKVSVQTLKVRRLQGRIKGTSLGNGTVYTLEQIEAADFTPEKSGPKSKKDEEANKQPEGDQWHLYHPAALAAAS
jgi:hypothetical protein